MSRNRLTTKDKLVEAERALEWARKQRDGAWNELAVLRGSRDILSRMVTERGERIEALTKEVWGLHKALAETEAAMNVKHANPIEGVSVALASGLRVRIMPGGEVHYDHP